MKLEDILPEVEFDAESKSVICVVLACFLTDTDSNFHPILPICHFWCSERREVMVKKSIWGTGDNIDRLYLRVTTDLLPKSV